MTVLLRFTGRTSLKRCSWFRETTAPIGRFLSMQVPTASTPKRLTTNQALELAKQWADQRIPRSAMISQWLKVNLDKPGGVGTSADTLCCVDSWPRPNIVVAIDFLKSYGDEKFPKLLMFTDYGIHDTHSAKMETFLLQVVDMIDVAKHGGIEIRGLYPEWRPLFDKIFADRLKLNASITVWQCRGYWLPPEERAWVHEHPLKVLKGFEFQSLRPDDADLVDGTWQFRVKDSTIWLVQRQIRDFPSVCLRETNGAKRLACFMMVEAEVGLMSHLYTTPAFRRRGLAAAVEYQLARLLIDKGHIPVKMVLRDNMDGVLISEASPVWKYMGDLIWVLYGDEKMARKYKVAKS